MYTYVLMYDFVFCKKIKKCLKLLKGYILFCIMFALGGMKLCLMVIAQSTLVLICQSQWRTVVFEIW